MTMPIVTVVNELHDLTSNDANKLIVDLARQASASGQTELLAKAVKALDMLNEVESLYEEIYEQLSPGEVDQEKAPALQAVH